ncbi:ACT domain-containing protein [Candidatus Moduliflexus flocculans]|uniref:ACT domain-containing protein n=1 Tax=Candidatus Moduliflexus flocculans TaxID=1499966 RepID=A0A0S6W130_9BACT|nr:ACT domain-containing protein [Candidatus Moduliflexus flocculans]
MAFDIKRVEYYNFIIEGQIGESTKLLSIVAEAGVNLLAFKAITLEPARTRFTLIPDDSAKMNTGAKNAGQNFDGPYPALFIKGENDESGELAAIYQKLSQAGIPVHESSGIANIKGSYGVILYLAPEDCEKATAALKI